MKIVINGGGGVGQALAEILSEEHHDVTVVEPNAKRAGAVQEAVDCRVVVGAGATPVVLREAAAGQADIFVAVTDRDEVNLLSCLMAHKLGCPRCIARVRHPSFNADDPAVPIGELGIDQIINPDEEASREIVRLLRSPGTTEVVPLAGGTVAAVGMTVAAGSPFDGRALAELPEVHGNLRYRVAMIRRQGKTIIPGGNDRIQAADEIFVVAERGAVERIGTMVGAADREEIASAMIFGANELGRSVASMLQGKCRVKLIDMKGRAAGEASEELSRTLVIESDGHDMDLLEREGLAQTDAFLAVDDHEETNLIACLYAKRMGVPRTIARVERPFYRPLTVSLGVDAAVSARQVTVNAILKYIRPGDIKAVVRMRGVPAEVLELVPRPGAKILNRPLRKVSFPRGALVGMVVRPDSVVVPAGETQIREGDHVIVFTLRDAVNKVQKLFS